MAAPFAGSPTSNSKPVLNFGICLEVLLRVSFGALIAFSTFARRTRAHRLANYAMHYKGSVQIRQYPLSRRSPISPNRSFGITK